jgi:hypothetical protein
MNWTTSAKSRVFRTKSKKQDGLRMAASAKLVCPTDSNQQNTKSIINKQPQQSSDGKPPATLKLT